MLLQAGHPYLNDNDELCFPSFHTCTAEEMLEHLQRHTSNGHNVPQYAFDGLNGLPIKTCFNCGKMDMPEMAEEHRSINEILFTCPNSIFTFMEAVYAEGCKDWE